MDGGNTILEA